MSIRVGVLVVLGNRFELLVAQRAVEGSQCCRNLAFEGRFASHKILSAILAGESNWSQLDEPLVLCADSRSLSADAQSPFRVAEQLLFRSSSHPGLSSQDQLNLA
jgi:hypothetical protein